MLGAREFLNQTCGIPLEVRWLAQATSSSADGLPAKQAAHVAHAPALRSSCVPDASPSTPAPGARTWWASARRCWPTTRRCGRCWPSLASSTTPPSPRSGRVPPPPTPPPASTPTPWTTASPRWMQGGRQQRFVFWNGGGGRRGAPGRRAAGRRRHVVSHTPSPRLCRTAATSRAHGARRASATPACGRCRCWSWSRGAASWWR